MTNIQEWSDRWWTSHDGLRLHAREYPGAEGEARLPVVCIHGLTRNARDFEDLAPWIAARERRVIAIDVRGRGASAWDPDPANYHPGIYAQDVARLFGRLGLSRALFVGTSMGGLITMALAAIAPQMIAGAALNDIGPKVEPEGIARLREYVGKDVDVADWDEAAAYAKRINELSFRKAPDHVWPKMARRLFVEGPAGLPVRDYDPAIARSLGEESVEAPEVWPLFQSLAKGRPLAVIRGGVSGLLSRETLGRMQAIAPQAIVAEVPEVGHAPFLDEPEALAALDAFFANAP